MTCLERCKVKRDYMADLDLRRRLLDWLKDNRISEKAAEMAAEAIDSGGKILIFGNGGSASQASHFAAELVNRFDFDRKAIGAIALTTDTANLTSIANDSSYSRIFSRQVEAIGSAGDLAIGLSTSGTSENVLLALETARQKGLKTIGIGGNNLEAYEKLPVDMAIGVPTDDTPAIQEMHLFILHRIAGYLEWKAGGEG